MLKSPRLWLGAGRAARRSWCGVVVVRAQRRRRAQVPVRHDRARPADCDRFVDRDAESGHLGAGRHAGLGPDQGTDCRLQFAREEERPDRAHRPGDVSVPGAPGRGRPRGRAFIAEPRAGRDSKREARPGTHTGTGGTQVQLAGGARPRPVGLRPRRRRGAHRGCRRAAARRDARVGAHRPRPHRDPGTGRRCGHQAQRRRRPDGRGQPAGAGAFHHREGPARHAGRNLDRRGRRRPHSRRPARELHRRCIPGPHLQRRSAHRTQGTAEHPERGDLHRDRLGEQRSRRTAARHDRQRSHRHR